MNMMILAIIHERSQKLFNSKPSLDLLYTGPASQCRILRTVACEKHAWNVQGEKHVKLAVWPWPREHPLPCKLRDEIHRNGELF